MHALHEAAHLPGSQFIMFFSIQLSVFFAIQLSGLHFQYTWYVRVPWWSWQSLLGKMYNVHPPAYRLHGIWHLQPMAYGIRLQPPTPTAYGLWHMA